MIAFKHLMLVLAMTAATSLAAEAADNAAWAPVGGHITTEWAQKINTTDGGWAVYPRPLLERKNWQNLNGLWQLAIVPLEADALQAKPTTQILVPYCVESALGGVGQRLDAEHALVYKRSFRVPGSWRKNGQHVMLNFGAVDWDATVLVNGREVGRHTGGYTPFSIDITQALQGKDNELVVRVADATNKGYQPCGKQRVKNRSIWYTLVSGIWQTVWIEPVPAARISDVHIVPDVDHGSVAIDAQVSAAGTQLRAEVLDAKGHVLTQATGDGGKVTVTMPQGFKLWSPDEPNLYELRLTLLVGGKKVDQVKSYTAMRKFSTRKDAEGHWRLQLNNRDIFEFGPLDQGWWPDGLYTAPGYEALCYDLVQTKQWGFNMVRKHVKVEPAVWYACCDKLGLIVWQDMPSGDYGAGQPWEFNNGYYRGVASKRSAASMANYYKEWGEVIDAFKSYPCISTWVPFNEAWGQFNTWSVVKWTRQRDPDTNHLINPSSGGNFYACGDMIDLHHYPEPKMFYYELERVNVLGEYGGLGLPVAGHTWLTSDSNWGYVKFKDAKELTDTYTQFAEKLIALSKQGLCAAVYTQTTDCETEINGIMTYDRRVVKMQPDRLREINQKVTHCLDK